MSWLHHIQYWLAVHTGTENEASKYYAFWSGFGSDLGEATLISAVLAVYKSHNCGVKWCPWIGKTPVAGTQHKTCHLHTTLARHHLLRSVHATDFPEQHAMMKDMDIHQ
jgi:hypothetical protein